jgi:hypothetical protein
MISSTHGQSSSRAASNADLSTLPLWSRGCAPRALRKAHAIIAFALPLCAALPARAEEPDLRSDAASAGSEAPAEELESTPSDADISEALASPAQGGGASNPEPSLERRARLDPPPAEPMPPAPPVSAPVTSGSGSGRLLGLRLPTFIAFGIGGLGAGGAVVTHLAAVAPYTDPKLGCNGRCADGSHTLGMTSTILAGLAVGALGTGVVLALSEPAREKKPLAPVLKMSVSPSKAAASASWAF